MMSCSVRVPISQANDESSLVKGYPDLCYLDLEGVGLTRQTVVGCAGRCFGMSHSGWFSNLVADIQVCSSEDLQDHMMNT